MIVLRKRFLYCIIFSVFLGIFVSTVGVAANIYLLSGNIVRIGAKDVKFNNDLYIIDEKTYVPIRELSEKMRIPILWNDEKKQLELLTDFKTIHVSDKTELKEEGIIPDEQTAYQIGKIILERYAGEPLEYETDERIYYLQTQFQEKSNSWRISQTYEFKNGNHGWSSGDAFYVPSVILNKNTGEVVSINTYSNIKR